MSLTNRLLRLTGVLFASLLFTASYARGHHRAMTPAAARVNKHAHSHHQSQSGHRAAHAQRQHGNRAHLLAGRALARERKALLLAQSQHAHHADNRLVAAAESFTGTPYQRGGLSSRGLDCSGLVVRAMGKQGRLVPHSSRELFRLGTPVRGHDLKPGDLVFFNTNGSGVSHVGIWVGHHQFVHASCKHGVRREELSGYYLQTLVGARRLR